MDTPTPGAIPPVSPIQSGPADDTVTTTPPVAPMADDAMSQTPVAPMVASAPEMPEVAPAPVAPVADEVSVPAEMPAPAVDMTPATPPVDEPVVQATDPSVPDETATGPTVGGVAEQAEPASVEDVANVALDSNVDASAAQTPPPTAPVE